MPDAAPILWSLPWILGPAVGLARSLHSRSLGDEPAEPPTDAPLVSIIIPARNERRNIERCARSVLATTYPALEVIVVDDHSTDGTGDLARAIAAEDLRLRVIESPALPPDWFGKQWACSTGATAAKGSLLLFADADTRHSPTLVARAVNAMLQRDADLLSVAGAQEMHSFWERVVQPQIFGILSLRYGGTEHVSRTKRPENAIANGQFILVRREAYDALGGHALVRHRVAEDLALAQEFVRSGRRIALLLGIDLLSTHMYASLGELVAGWRKNIYAGGRDAVLGGRMGRALYPALLVATPLIGLAPPLALVLSMLGLLSAAWLVWGAIGTAVALVFWGCIYAFMREPMRYAVLYPLGLLVVLYIAVGAVRRGSRVGWKGRDYVAR
jgi:chlorobactene glucosyltransferase